jgi:Antibiotic biosynthesis monooxygenase
MALPIATHILLGRLQEVVNLRGDSRMFVNLVIHYPHPDKEVHLLEAMQQLSQAVQNQPGLYYIKAHKEAQRGVVVAISIWETQAAMLAAAPLIMGVTKDIPFDDWEARPREIYRLESVEWSEDLPTS